MTRLPYRSHVAALGVTVDLCQESGGQVALVLLDGNHQHHERVLEFLNLVHKRF